MILRKSLAVALTFAHSVAFGFPESKSECEVKLEKQGPKLTLRVAQSLVNDLAIKHPLLFGDGFLSFLSTMNVDFDNTIKLDAHIDHNLLENLSGILWTKFVEKIKTKMSKGSEELGSFFRADAFEAHVLAVTALEVDSRPHLKSLVIELISYTLPDLEKIVWLRRSIAYERQQGSKRRARKLTEEAANQMKSLLARIVSGAIKFEPATIEPASLSLSLSKTQRTHYESLSEKGFSPESLVTAFVSMGDAVMGIERELQEDADTFLGELSPTRNKTLEALKVIEPQLQSAKSLLLLLRGDLEHFQQKSVESKEHHQLVGLANTWLARVAQLTDAVIDLESELQTLKQGLIFATSPQAIQSLVQKFKDFYGSWKI